MAGKFVEFFGEGVSQLSVPDRTTIANMCPEYSATISFFPIDAVALQHFKKTRESSACGNLLVSLVFLWCCATFLLRDVLHIIICCYNCFLAAI